VTVRVSVVIPVFNGEAFVANAVRSALTQTIPDIEVLVADNGSTDRTWAVLERLAAEDGRVRPLRALSGRGADVARNACLDVAVGDWIAPLDADDLMHPERLERLLRFAGERQAKVVADNQRLVDPQGRLIRLAWHPHELPARLDAADFVMGNLFGRRMASLGYLKPMYRRELIAGGLRYQPRPRVVEDYILMLAMLLSGATLHLLPEALYDYVQMPNSLSRSFGVGELTDCQTANDAVLATAEDPRLRRALLLRRRSIAQLIAHAVFIDTLKKRRWAHAAGQVLRYPAVIPFIVHYGRESILKRLQRMAGLGLPRPLPEPAPTVAYFGQDCTDSAVIRRISSFQALGLDVLGFTFRRQKFNRSYLPRWDNVALGETRDRHYAARLFKLLRAARRIIGQRRRLAGVTLFYARNIDMALLALFARLTSRSAAPLVYEVLDVQRAFLGKSMGAKVLRWVERRVLAQSRLLVVSSPGFVREYFKPLQGYRGEWFLLENKILGPQLRALPAQAGGGGGEPLAARRDGHWVIGWFGTLRCVESLDMLARLAAALPDRLLVYLRGFPTETGLEPFLRVVDRHPNMIYGGEFFSPNDLPALYGGIDFAWGFDFLDKGGNSDWLLPNRLYDAGYFNVPILAAAPTETGRRVAELGIGWTFGPDFVGELEHFLATVTAAEVAGRRRFMAELPRSLFCDDDDTKRLIKSVLAPAAEPFLALPADTPSTAE
jgi:succinoglycan biosynthesis protein ExoL